MEELILKQFGLQRSGTNYLRYLLESNYHIKVLTNVGGWKHGYYTSPELLRDEMSCAICHKEPYSWLVSCYDYLNLKDTTFEKFLHNTLVMKGIVYKEAGKSPYHIRAANPIHYWNNLTLNWLGITLLRGRGKQNPNNKNTVYHIRYEEILRDPQKTLDQYFLAYRRKNKAFKRPLEELKRNWDKHNVSEMLSDLSFNKRRGYYLRSKFFKKYTQNILDYVNSQLDIDVMKEIEYEIILKLPQFNE